LDALEEGVGGREFLVIKLEALGAGIVEGTDADSETSGGEM
jgi:hypothetical protein